MSSNAVSGTSKYFLPIAALVACLHAFPAQASEATIVELYRDCRLADTTVLIDPGVLTPEQGAEVKARAAAATRERGSAVAGIVRTLKRYGIDEVEISRQGFEGCEPNTSGKFVEAIGTYCGSTLTRAELRIDRETVMSRSDPQGTFEAFLDEAAANLRQQGIYDRPIVTIENSPGCEESS